MKCCIFLQQDEKLYIHRLFTNVTFRAFRVLYLALGTNFHVYIIFFVIIIMIIAMKNNKKKFITQEELTYTLLLMHLRSIS